MYCCHAHCRHAVVPPPARTAAQPAAARLPGVLLLSHPQPKACRQALPRQQASHAFVASPSSLPTAVLLPASQPALPVHFVPLHIPLLPDSQAYRCCPSSSTVLPAGLAKTASLRCFHRLDQQPSNSSTAASQPASSACTVCTVYCPCGVYSLCQLYRRHRLYCIHSCHGVESGSAAALCLMRDHSRTAVCRIAP